ncbi:MAG: conjugal transfer protein TraG N-terminal domain-containing protein, partial [Candidatus Thiodiazotropha sp. (ex Lucinoma borealis)]|nr:conjugal transfer protein TraG N-terminal domain-containing protein [Candidatus Thiodiazotropha sp. (ex Lucinoma borealis)]
ASVQVPLLWYAVSSLTSGINAAIKAMLPDQEDIRRLLHGMSYLSISDQSLQDEIRRFNQDCYYPSLAAVRQFQLSGNPSTDAPAETVTDFQAAMATYESQPYGDLSYIGARQLLNTRGLYRLCDSAANCPHQDAIGPNAPVAGWEGLYDFTSPARMGPNCENWWSSNAQGLKRHLVDYIRAERPAATSYFDDIGAGLGFVSDEDRNDTLVIRALGNTDIALESGSAGDNWFDSLVGGASAMVLNGMMSLINGFIVDGLPLFQAYLVMITAAMLPLVMLVTLYSPKSVIALAFFLMAILLWPGLWAIAGWVDNVLLDSIYSGYSILGLQLHGTTALLSIIAMLGYVVLPVYFTKMLTTAGIHAGEAAQSGFDSLQNSVNSGVSNVGGGVVRGLSNKAMRR